MAAGAAEGVARVPAVRARLPRTSTDNPNPAFDRLLVELDQQVAARGPLDCVVLGATEVDLGFNGNVVTHSDGRLLHGIGGWQNCLFSKCTILPIPSFRDRIPVIVDQVTTLCGPGELIDVIVTERGIAINPLRRDLVEALSGSSLPIRPLAEIKAEVEDLCGGPAAKPRLTEKVVAAIKWVDGTVIDSVRQLEKH